jgi:hypothetical protein
VARELSLSSVGCEVVDVVSEWRWETGAESDLEVEVEVGAMPAAGVGEAVAVAGAWTTAATGGASAATAGVRGVGDPVQGPGLFRLGSLVVGSSFTGLGARGWSGFRLGP